MSNIYDWAENEIELACKNTTDHYTISCYKSALKAFKSLCDDDHSECSIAFTQHILNELIDTHPLTPIEDTPDVWNCVKEDADRKLYQCNRMASLFKTVYSDGKTTYKDIDRCVCESIGDHSRFHSNESTRIIDKLFPITMPYLPKDHYVFLVDEIEEEPDELLGTAYLKLFKNGNPIDFEPIYILYDDDYKYGTEVDKEKWMSVKENKDDKN